MSVAEGSKSKSAQADSAGGDGGEGGGGGRSRVIRKLIGYLLVPALLIGALFAAGVHVGARQPDMVLTRAVLWLTGAEAERPPPAEASAAAASEDEGLRLPPPPSGPPELLELAFAWPLPAQAIVEESVEDPDQSVKLRYRIEVERQGDELLVHHRDPRILELDGRAVELDPKRAELEARARGVGFIPSMAASLDGEFLRVIDLDAYIERTREVLAGDPDEREAFVTRVSSPEGRQKLEQGLGDIWRCWASAWSGLEIRTDHDLRFENHEGAAVYRVVGIDAERIALEYRFEDEFTKTELRTLFAAAKLDPELDGVRGGEEAVWTATLGRDTLRPLRIDYEVDMWIHVPGESRETYHVTRRYTFDWR